MIIASLGDVLVGMLIFFFWVIWIYLLITVFIDVFRSDDLSGWAKALWVIFVIILPFLGVFVYLIARGRSMQERQMKQAQQRDEATHRYIQQAAAGADSTADDLAKLADLRDQGVISDEEFNRLKAKALE